MALTAAQAETIMDILGTFGQDPFAPDEVYPGRDNRDNGGRRTIRSLARKGLLAKVPTFKGDSRSHIIEDGEAFRYRLTDDALEAFKKAYFGA